MWKLIKIVESVQKAQIPSDQGANTNKIQLQQYKVDVEVRSRLQFHAVLYHQLTKKLFGNVRLAWEADVQWATIAVTQSLEALTARQFIKIHGQQARRRHVRRLVFGFTSHSNHAKAV